MKDKNGKEIKENDIVVVGDPVEFSPNNFMRTYYVFSRFGDRMDMPYAYSCVNNGDFMVIGRVTVDESLTNLEVVGNVDEDKEFFNLV